MKCLDVYATSPNYFHKGCMENSDGDMHVHVTLLGRNNSPSRFYFSLWAAALRDDPC